MQTKVKRGRPRNAATDLAILDAAATLMAKQGYRGMTVGAVAAAAGVTEPTVYLRHATKHDLAVAAIPRLPMLTHPPDTGDTRADVMALLHEFVGIGETIGLAVVGVVLVEESEHPELLDRWRTTVGAAGLRAVGQIVERGRQRGEVRADVKESAVADLILGAYLAHYTHRGQPDDAWTADIVNTVWRGLALG